MIVGCSRVVCHLVTFHLARPLCAHFAPASRRLVVQQHARRSGMLMLIFFPELPIIALTHCSADATICKLAWAAIAWPPAFPLRRSVISFVHTIYVVGVLPPSAERHCSRATTYVVLFTRVTRWGF